MVIKDFKRYRNSIESGLILGFIGSLSASCSAGSGKMGKGADKPNLVFVFADQWRAEAAGFAGNAQVKTPNLDRLAAESVNFSTAISTCPVSSPARASILTGQYPLTHGIFFNDKPLADNATSIAEVYREHGTGQLILGNGI